MNPSLLDSLRHLGSNEMMAGLQGMGEALMQPPPQLPPHLAPFRPDPNIMQIAMQLMGARNGYR